MNKAVCKNCQERQCRNAPRTNPAAMNITPQPNRVAHPSDSPSSLGDSAGYCSDRQYRGSRSGTPPNEGSCYDGSRCRTPPNEGSYSYNGSRCRTPPNEGSCYDGSTCWTPANERYYSYGDSRCGTSPNKGTYSYDESRSGTPENEGSYSNDGSRSGTTSYDGSYSYGGSSSDSELRSQDSWDPKRFSIVSHYMLCAAVIVCILGMLLFTMRTEEPADSGHICDEWSEWTPKTDRNKMQRAKDSKAMEVDYASDAYGAYVELHNAFHHMSRETLSAADLVRLPAVHSVSPAAILKDNDECFSMQGSSGKFLIRLSRPVIVKAITLVHNKRECDTAPKEFRIYGLKSTNGDRVNLGAFRYENRGMAAQKFAVNRLDEFAQVGLEILKNWGNREFTCIYKIKVHGEPAD